MNYRDFYKNNKRRPVSEEVEESLIQGVDLDEPAVDDGLPKRADGSLDAPHDGRPIHLSKIIQIGSEFSSGESADGAVSGYSNIGVNEKSKGANLSRDGEGVSVEKDKEHITSGGKAVTDDIASKTVGDKVVSGGGQRQSGPNHAGCIAGTPKTGEGEAEGDNVLSLEEAKSRLRGMVKEALKEITFNKQSGRWEKLTENHDDAGFATGASGRPQYKVAGPQFRTAADVLARTRQYEPEITEMHDEEQEFAMQERYTELANASRNLSESELSELRDLGFKLENHENNDCNCGAQNGSEHRPHSKDCNVYKNETVNMKMGPSYKKVQPNQVKTSQPDFFARTNQYDPEVTEYGAPVIEPGVEPETEPWSPEPETEPEPAPAPATPQEPAPQTPDPLQPERPGIAPRPRGYRTNEAGGAAIQHSSVRTVNDRPQVVKNRHRGDIDEAKKKVHEVRNNDWTTIHDIAIHCKRSFPTINSSQLKKVIPILFEQNMDRKADPKSIEKIVAQVEARNIRK